MEHRRQRDARLRLEALLFVTFQGIGSLAAQSAAPGSFKLVARADAFVTSGYDWRGMHRSSGPLFQFDGAGGITFGALAASGGLWTNLDPRRSSSRHYSDLPLGMKGFSEYDAWAQLSFQTQRITVAGGGLWIWYRRPGADPRVTEVFGQIRLQTGRWSHSLQAWHAVDGAKGTYLEPAISYDHLVWPFAGPSITWISALHGGVQLGHRDASASVPGAEGTGLTHLSLGNGVRVTMALFGCLALTAAGSLEIEYRRDPALRLRPNGTLGHRVMLWLPAQIGLTLPWRRPGQ